MTTSRPTSFSNVQFVSSIRSRPSLQAFFGGRFAGFGQHALKRHRLAALALAFVGGFHESVDFERFLFGHGHFSRAEEADDLDHQRTIPLVRADLLDAVRAEGRAAVVGLAAPLGGADPAEGADAASLPDSGCQVDARSTEAAHQFTAGTHDG